MRGVVSFVGAGPGASDLITLRGAQRLADADLVVYTTSVVDVTWLREHTAPTADLVDIGRSPADETAARYRRLASSRQRAVHLVAGDPAYAGEVRELLDLCGKLGLDTEIVPGVGQVSASARGPLLEPGTADSVAYVVVETDFDRVRALAEHAETLVVQAPAARAAELVEALTSAGVDPATPVAIAYKTTWPDEVSVASTVADLVADVKAHNIWRQALFLVGEALREDRRPEYAADPAAPRWTARNWQRTEDAPRSTWARRRGSGWKPEPGSAVVGPDRAAEPGTAEAGGQEGGAGNGETSLSTGERGDGTKESRQGSSATGAEWKRSVPSDDGHSGGTGWGKSGGSGWKRADERVTSRSTDEREIGATKTAERIADEPAGSNGNGVAQGKADAANGSGAVGETANRASWKKQADGAVRTADAEAEGESSGAGVARASKAAQKMPPKKATRARTATRRGGRKS